MAKIMILEVVQSLDMGGAERVAADLALFGDREKLGFVFCVLGAQGVFAQGLKDSNIEVISLNKGSGFAPGLSFRIAEIIKAKKIDVLHTHNQRPQIYGALAARLARVPFYVHTRHSKNEPDSFKNMALSRFAGLRADSIVCVSDAVYRYSLENEKIPQHKLRIIKNGIDVSRFKGDGADTASLRSSLGMGPGTIVVGTVGRLAKVKNQRMLIDAFIKVESRIPDSRLLLVGDGPLKDELKSYAASARLGAKIIFLGERKDIAGLLKVFNVFALSSFSEGLPVVLLEAMASGLAVAATAVGGIPELIKDQENGILVPSADAAAMSEAIIRLAQNEPLRTRISENNRTKAFLEFDVKRMCGEYTNLYESLLARAG